MHLGRFRCGKKSSEKLVHLNGRFDTRIDYVISKGETFAISEWLVDVCGKGW
jgi:hypothetical protein